MERLRDSGATIIALILRVTVSVVVLAVIVSRVSLGDILARAGEGRPLHLAATLGLALSCFVLAALRWRLVAGCVGVVVPVGLAVRAQFGGMFGGQALPAGVGIGMFRGWLVSGQSGRVSRVVGSLLTDRLVALFAACVLACPSLVGLLGPTPVPRSAGLVLGPLAVLAAGGAAVALLLGFSRRDGRSLDAGPIGIAVVMALTIHATAVLMAALAAGAYAVDPSLALWFAVIPVSAIASAIPVSLNGWGVREAAIVVLAAPWGVPPAQALLVSMTLGVVNLVASLPGALVLLQDRRGDPA